MKDMENIKMITREASYDNIISHKKIENPKVSVIVPVYKVDRFLVPCLDSIVNQSLEEIEIIIVDEGDHDRCREIIDYYESIDPRIIAPHEKNGGYGASCNKGFDLAKGEYIAIVESDDMIETSMCEEMYAYAKKLGADVVKTPFCYWNGEDGKDDCEYRYEVAQQCPKDKLFSARQFDILLKIHASLWAGLYRADYLKKNNIRFIEAKGGAYVDVGFRIDTLIHTDKIAWLDKIFYLYRTNNEDSTTNKFNLTAMLMRWKEVHAKFSALGDDYKNYYEAALVRDEYLNTLSYINHSDILFTKEQMDMLIDNFNHIDEEIVKTTRALNDNEKNEILSFKRNPIRHYKKIKRKIKAKKIYSYFNKCSHFLRQENNIKFEIAAIFCAMLILFDSNKIIYMGPFWGMFFTCLLIVFSFISIVSYMVFVVKIAIDKIGVNL